MVETELLNSDNPKNKFRVVKRDFLVPTIGSVIFGIIKAILGLAADETLGLTWKAMFISFLKQILELPHIAYLLFIFCMVNQSI